LIKIGIHSVPRSGSTWLGAIFDSHPDVTFRMQPLFSYAFKDYLSENSSLERINSFFQEINNSKDDFLNQLEAKKDGLIPNFKKSDTPSFVCYKEVRYHHILNNLLKKDGDIKIIGIIRNPFSVINSWLKAPKEFKVELGWKIEEEWRYAPSKNQNKPEEFNGYEKWKEVTFLFLELKENFPDRFYLLEYEKILANAETEVTKLFSFCNLTSNAQTLQFLERSTQSHNSDPYSVFKQKNKDDKWKHELPANIIIEIKNDPEFNELNQLFNWL
tara:strand:+ start:349 stop:1164 length:816 start_codon:yes stop_codon:yes gene_type:complete